MPGANSRIDSNALGDRGEAILVAILTTFHGKRPLFRPVLLGAKWPVADLAVELVGRPGAFFLVQAKSTRQGLNRNRRLRAGVSLKHFNSLVTTKVPTYIVGIDDHGEAAFISAALTRRRATLSSLCTRFPLREEAVRLKLFDEVASFWMKVRRARIAKTSKLKDT
jgi:hypothetical protein